MSKRGGRKSPVLTDWHLWAEVARTVSPLRPKKPILSFGDGPLPIPDPQPAPPPAPGKKPQKLPSHPTAPSYRPPVSGRQTEPGRIIEPMMRRKVARGRIEIEGTIDLHGMRQDEARAALGRFIYARVARGDRTILVITGKGLKKIDDTTIVERGVLRTMLPLWLSEPQLAPMIAGWDVSAQGHGGEGAYYVRLRRSEKSFF
jgi:DNA-nicking Smr family endonuclease